MSIKKYYNFLSKEELDFVVKDSLNYLNNEETFTTNFTRWDPKIVRDSNVVLIKTLKEGKKEKKIKSTEILLKNFKKLFGSSPDGLSFFYWSQGSYIPWHDDEGKIRACTLYLNEEWDPLWGGFFAFRKNDEDPIMIKPELNLLIEQTNNILHCTTPTTNFSKVRITVQAFWSKN